MYNKNSEIIKVNQYIIDNKEKLNYELSECIRNLRISKKINKEEMAERTMTATSYISQIENGRYGLSVFKFLLICNALEVSPNEILESFLYGNKKNEDIFYNELQQEKDLSKNVINFLKKKESEY